MADIRNDKDMEAQATEDMAKGLSITQIIELSKKLTETERRKLVKLLQNEFSKLQ